jgi:predicted Zn-dependent peptidase
VVNYIAGNLLGSSSTVFEIIDKYRLIHQDKLAPDYYNSLIKAIRKVKTDQISDIANTYFNNLSVCIVA